MATKPPAKPKPMKTRSKPSAAFAKAMKADTNATVVRTGTVTAVRWDGSVNLGLGGQKFIGVACAQSYQDRKVGDRVQVIMHGGMPFVMGAVGGDPDSNSPDFFSTDQAQYTWGLNQTTGQNQKIWANEGMPMRIGRPGDREPVYGGKDVYYQAAFSYWDGAANQLNTDATPTDSIDLFVARSDWDEGDLGPAYFTLWGHKMDALPASPQSLLLNTSLDPKSIDFTLEAGELKVITLPDTWRDNIGAATLDANTIRGFLITPQAPDGEPWAVDNSYAILSTLTCGVRVYTQ
ncbi:hypothetical protein SEA_STUFF_28 [Streptomyces phage Stuff]|nr:hypothetical protein SEA_STUFF_28 [Streptomyces phage Stuff]